MKGTVWQRCTRCMRKVNGADARKRHRASGCPGSSASWAFKVDLGRDGDGKRRQQVRGGFASEAVAERELRAMLTKVDGGRHVERSRRTLADYLAEWLDATAPPKVAHGTHAKRRLHVDRYVGPRVGGLALDAVNGATLDRLYATLLREGKADGTGLAASTVSDVSRTLHKAFADARRWHYMDRNPCEEADPPRQDQVAQDARAALHVWTPVELRTFLVATAEHRHHAAWHVAAHTGMRRSELCALAWSDVDLERGTLRIARKLVKGDDGYELRQATKTSAGARTIALDAATVSVLLDQGVRQLEVRDKVGDAYDDGGLVFARVDGQPISPPSLTQAFRRAVKAAGLPRIRLHDLRHTHATILLQNGTPVKTVSKRLGHASAMVTMTIYSHVLPGDDQGAADRFAALLAEDEA